MMLTLNCDWAVPGDVRFTADHNEMLYHRGSGTNAIYGVSWCPKPAANDNQPVFRHGR